MYTLGERESVLHFRPCRRNLWLPHPWDRRGIFCMTWHDLAWLVKRSDGQVVLNPKAKMFSLQDWKHEICFKFRKDIGGFIPCWLWLVAKEIWYKPPQFGVALRLNRGCNHSQNWCMAHKWQVQQLRAATMGPRTHRFLCLRNCQLTSYILLNLSVPHLLLSLLLLM